MVYGVLQVAEIVHPWAAYVWKLYIVWSLIALGDLCRHGKRVAKAAEANDLEQARYHTGMLVGRDLDKMTVTDCCRATIESLSENLTDGVLSPLFFYIIFGIPGLVIFKVISTVVFYLILTPIALVMRAFGKKFLIHKTDSSLDTYYEDYVPHAGIDKQF